MNQQNTSAPVAENKMGTMPVGRLVLNMSLPMMISMLVQALYNIVDSVFVAMLSENALTAVSMAFPLQTLLIAVGAGTGVGMNALLSKSLGEKNFKKANQAAENAAFLYFLSFLVFLILGFLVVKPFYASQVSQADSEIMQYGIQYLSIVMIFSLGMFGQFFYERVLASTGKTIFSMISQLCGAFTNIILDPILIFGLLGAPKMGCSTILDMATPNLSRSSVTNSACPEICPVNEQFPVDYHSKGNNGARDFTARVRQNDRGQSP